MVNSKIKALMAATSNVTLVAATKYVDSKTMLELLKEGINNFGENRVDSFLTKYQELKSHEEIVWHFIGTLQSNKVSKIINKIDYLHSLNSLRLARYIDKYRLKPLKCYLEINITNNPNKKGILPTEAQSFLLAIKTLPNVMVIGLMAMTDKEMTDNEKYQAFLKLKNLRDELFNAGFTNVKELSMGMSDDYELALKAQATTIRLGRILFETEGV